MSEQEEGGKGTGILTFFAISFFEAGEVTEDKENSLNTLRRARGGRDSRYRSSFGISFFFFDG
jgi:hypothetical protein